MDRLWKYLSVVILLQLAMMAYIFLRVPNTLKVHSDSATLRISKKDLNIPDEQGAFNSITDVIKPNKSRKHLPLSHRRFYLSNNSFYSNGEIQLKARKGKLLNLMKLKRKRNFNIVIRINTLESKESATRDTKNTTLTTTNVSLNHSNITKKCKFSIDNNSLYEARKKIVTSQSVYLFFINLELDNSTSFRSEKKDMFFHWQYVLKKEKFLVQLPVDFDLFTFRLLSADSEETVLNVKLIDTNSNCNLSENLAEKIHSVRALLWNELFQNDTRFYLCNRHIQDEWNYRDAQYLITTIWVGYDLNCSEVSDEYGVHEVQLTKDDLPLVTPIFCYFLSLQFVWIFVLLDVYKLTRDDELINYTEDDRPYSAKRFIKKILYKECFCICYCCCDKCKMCRCRCCKIPVRRLLFLIWLFILVPVGLYRTLGRYFILDIKMYHDYFSVVKTSEPLFNLLPTRIQILRKELYSEKNYEKIILGIDSIYATCFPLIFVFVGEILYREFLSDEEFHCHENEKKNRNTEETVPLINFRETNDYNSINVEGNNEDNREKEKRHSTDIRLSEKFSKPSKILVKHLMCLISCICFNCSGRNEPDENKYKKYPCCRCEDCSRYSKNIGNENKNDKNEVNKNEKVYCYCLKLVCNCVKFTISFFNVFVCRTISFLFSFLCCIALFLCYLSCCLFPIIPFSCPTVSAVIYDLYDKRILRTICMLLIAPIQFLFLYFLCLRPIISTFIFMFRSFTYFVFVALLVRTHIMQFTLIFVTTFAYFLKYLSEIINMNVDILKYIITLQKSPEQNNKHNEEQTDKQTNEQKDNQNDNQNDRQSDKENAEENDKQTDKPKIDENIFTYIYENLDFVRKKIYFLCLKTLVIFMYLFITIETFIRNKNSLDGSSVKSIIEFLLLIIGPYAITFFLKTNKGDFLSDENKKEIEQKLDDFSKETTNQKNVRSVKNAGEHALVVQNL